MDLGDKPSRQELAYASVRQRIRDGRYGAGSRLIISDIAKELGTSPIPIREALRRLEAEGLVKFLHNQGVIVHRVSAEDYVDTLATLAILEGYMTVMVSETIDAAGIQELKDINDRMATAWANGDAGRFGALNKEFHFAIYRHCTNRLMVDFATAAWARLENVRQTSIAMLPGRGQTSLAEHRAIIEALETHADKAAIETMAREHKLGTIRHFRTWQAESGLVD